MKRLLLTAGLVVCSAASARAQTSATDDDDSGVEVIEIVGEGPETGEAPKRKLSVSEIRTMPGTGNDALKSIQSLPGVSRIPFGLGGLVFRGTAPRDSSVYLEGIRVPLLYHFGGLTSFFPSAMLSGLQVTPGGYGVEFGRSQGGLVNIDVAEGRSDRWRFATEVSLIDSSVRADGPAPGGGSVRVGVRRSYVDAILAFAVPDDSDVNLTLAPRYYDAQLIYDTRVAGGRLRALLFGADDRLALLNDSDPDDPSRFRWQQSFVRAGLRYSKVVRGIDIDALGWLGYDQNSIRVTDAYTTRDSIPAGSRVSGSYITSWGQVSSGIDVYGARVATDSLADAPPQPGQLDVDEDMRTRLDDALWYADTGVWAQLYYRIAGGKAGVRPGIRVDRFGLTEQIVVNPRLSVSQDVGDVKLKQTFGLYHQPPVPADVDPVVGNPELKASYSVQATAGARTTIANRLQVSATGFYSNLRGQPVDVVSSATPAAQGRLGGGAQAASIEALSEQWGVWAYQENRGRGRTYGLELLAKYASGRWNGWLAYTYSRSFRRDDPDQLMGDRRYQFDQPHVLTALGSVRLGKWRLGGRVRFTSGNPITPVVGTYFDTDKQEYMPISGDVLAERLPAFFQLDLRVDRVWKRRWGTLSLFLDVQNVTNRVNPEGVSYNFDYTQRDYTRGLPIFPSIGLEFRQ